MNHTEKEYHTKFGSLFAEFKNKRGFFSTQYYTVFFTRRLSYLLAQVYLSQAPYIQAGVNIGFSVLQLGYLLYYLPFREIHILVSVISGEVAAGIFITMSTFYINGISSSTSEKVETIMIYSVIGGISVQFFVSAYSIFISCRDMWNKIIKYRAKVLIKTATKLKRMSFKIN